MDEIKSSRSISERVRRLTLDQKKYGSITEFQAGHELLRHFFLAGAAGSIAKTISDSTLCKIHWYEVRREIHLGSGEWKDCLPQPTVSIIRQHGVFDYREQQ